MRAGRVLRAVTGFLRRHPGAVVVVTAGVVLRVLMIVAYPPALWFQGDSGTYIRLSDTWPAMPARWPFMWFLKAFEWTETFRSVVVIQHLAGVAVAVASYVLLRRLGAGPWLGALAVTPLLLDASQVTLEQYLLTETLFTTLVAAAALLVAWRDRPGALACGIAGFVVTLGWATRPTGMLVAAALLLFLLVRWRGWRAPLAYLVGAGAMLALINAGAPSLGEGLAMSNPKFLYGRTAHFADCDRLTLRPEVRVLCPTQPLDQRPERPDWFLWTKESPIRLAKDRPDLLREFSREVIRQQPGDYARAVATDSLPFVVPVRLGPAQSCLQGWWRPPLYPTTWAKDVNCVPRTASLWYQPQPSPSADVPPTGLSRFLHAYGKVAVMPPWAMSLAVLLALVGALWPLHRRRLARCVTPATRHLCRSGRLRAVGLLYLAIGVGIALLSVATSMYDHRYGLPALVFVPVAAAAGWQRLRKPRDEQVPIDEHPEPARAAGPAQLSPAATG